MKFNLKRAFESILQWRESAKRQDDLPVSMVLLRREARFPTLDQLRSAGERAFGTCFGEDKQSRHFVVPVALFVMMKAGPHTISFLNHTKPYGESDFPQEFERLLTKETQRKAWREHTAWTAVDYVKGGTDLKLEYTVLATVCAELIDISCLGVYIPGKLVFIPNDGSLRGELQRLSMSQPLGVTSDRAPN